MSEPWLIELPAWARQYCWVREKDHKRVYQLTKEPHPSELSMLETAFQPGTRWKTQGAFTVTVAGIADCSEYPVRIQEFRHGYTFKGTVFRLHELDIIGPVELSFGAAIRAVVLLDNQGNAAPPILPPNSTISTACQIGSVGSYSFASVSTGMPDPSLLECLVKSRKPDNFPPAWKIGEKTLEAVKLNVDKVRCARCKDGCGVVRFSVGSDKEARGIEKEMADRGFYVNVVGKRCPECKGLRGGQLDE